MKGIVVLGLVALLAFGAFWLFSGDKTYDGLWKTEGYGLLFKVDGGRVTTYQVSGEQLVPYEALDGKVRSNRLKLPVITLDLAMKGERLAVTTGSGTPMFEAERIDTLDTYEIVEPTEDPFVNYEVFFKTFEENYPFFDLYGVDWQDLKQERSMLVEAGMSQEDFFRVLANSLTYFNDDHVYVQWGDTVFTPYTDLPQWHVDKQSKPLVEVIESAYFGTFTYSDDRYIRYGRLDDKTGYILIATMAGYESENEAVEKVAGAFGKALKALEDTERIVLDLRFNRGGFDAVGLAMAGYFTESEQLAYSKSVKTPKGYTDMLPVSIVPQTERYTDKPIVLLTSGATVSAAETFVLAMKTLPNVQSVGEQTAGFYSDMMERQLPNGMTFGLPHIRYFNRDGDLMETKGMVPDVEVPIDLEAMKAQRDPALEWAKTQWGE